MASHTSKNIAVSAMVAMATGTFSLNSHAQGVVNALCSTDAPRCAAAAAEFTRQAGIQVNQADPHIPSIDSVKLIKYGFEKSGKSAERRGLIDQWTKEVEALPR